MKIPNVKNFAEECHDMISILKNNEKPEIIDFLQKERDEQINRVQVVKITQFVLIFMMLSFYISIFLNSGVNGVKSFSIFFARDHYGILLLWLFSLLLLSYIKKKYKDLIEQIEELINKVETDANTLDSNRIKKEMVESVINYRKVLADKLSFDDIDEKIQAKFNRYKIVDTDFQIFIGDHYDVKNEITVVSDSILYYCIGFVFDEATNGSAFPFLLNDAEFVLTRANAMRYASEICELEGEEIEKYIDFGIDYSKRRVSEKMI